MNFDQWPTWRRALALNLLGATGIAIGLATGARLSPTYSVPIVVFTFAFLNFLFLAVRPRIVAARASGTRAGTVEISASVIRERPFILALVILQLIGVSRGATLVVMLIQAAKAESARALPNVLTFRLEAGMFAAIAGIWLLGAVGLWRKLRWAWWLAIVLNGLAAGVSGLLQFSDLHSYVFDPFATVAVILLLLPAVKERFKGSPRLDTAASSPTA